MVYLNGRLPLSSLTPIGGGLYMEHRAAVAWIAARAVILVETGIAPVVIEDGAYRDLAGQRRQKADAIADGAPMRAATPGYSTHGDGVSLDINNIWQYNLPQLERIMARFGFRRNIPFESWHFTHNGTTLASSSATPIGDTLSASEVAEIKAHITAETERLAGYVRREARLRLYRNNQQQLDGKPNPRFGQVRAISISTGVDYPIRSEGQLASLRLNGYSYIGDGDFDSMQQVDDLRFRNIVADCAKIRVSLGGSGAIAEPDPFA